jgi:NAD(P)H dehydrogenase (quinone)
MTEPTKVAIVYYSATGNVHALAQGVADGAAKAGAEVRLRKVRELAPVTAIASNPAWTAHAAAASNIPEAELEDLE